MGKSERIKFLTDLLAKEDKIETLLILDVPFADFEKKYPYFTCDEKTEDVDKQGKYPSQIIDDFLWLGGPDNSRNEEQLKNLGIDTILNLAAELSTDLDTSKYHYLKMGVDDTSLDDLRRYFERTLAFIEKAKKRDGKILVHCAMGISRSSCIAIAYLMRTLKLKYDDAKQIVLEKRPIINPNKGFVKQLISWENEIISGKFSKVKAPPGFSSLVLRVTPTADADKEEVTKQVFSVEMENLWWNKTHDDGSTLRIVAFIDNSLDLTELLEQLDSLDILDAVDVTSVDKVKDDEIEIVQKIIKGIEDKKKGGDAAKSDDKASDAKKEDAK